MPSMYLIFDIIGFTGEACFVFGLFYGAWLIMIVGIFLVAFLFIDPNGWGVNVEARETDSAVRPKELE